MKRKSWKKWVTLAAAAGMLISQIGSVSVWAAEGQDAAGTMTEMAEETDEAEECAGKEKVLDEEKSEAFEEMSQVSEESVVTETSSAMEECTGMDETGGTQEESTEVIYESETVDEVTTSESLGSEEDIINQVSNITWSVNGDVLVITGEGKYETVENELRSAMEKVKYICFANCKISGSMSGAFINLSNLENIDLSGLDTSQVTAMSYMFKGCSGLSSLDVSGFDTSRVTYMYGMFDGCSSLTNLDVSRFDTSQVREMAYMFHDCSDLTSLDVKGFNTSQVTDMSGIFMGCNGLTSLDVSGFDTSQVTDMGCMFQGCNGLTSLDVSGFDTSQVTDMSGMFEWCSGLTSLDVSGLDTSQVKDMSNMFYCCRGLTSIDVNGFDTSQVTDMSNMFMGCSGLTSLDVSGLDTSQVKRMGYMFMGCSGLTSLCINGLNTSQVIFMYYMFYGCSGLTSLDVSGLDTSQVVYMQYMFQNCSGLISLDVSGFDTSQVTDTDGMFTNCHPQEIRTPKALNEDCTITLDGTYNNPEGVKTKVLTADFLSTVLTLVKDVPEPAKFAVVGTIGGRNVTFSTDTEDTVIYYSSKTSNLTTEDACVENGETVLFENFYGTIYARAYANGQWGNVSRLILKIPVVNQPVITSSNGVVTIKTSTPNSTIYYTTDGSTPSPTNGKRLTNSAGSFTVSANCTVKAIAVRSCFTNSEIASASVTAKKLGAPSFAVKGVIGGRAVTFNTTESQGEIYYSFTTSNITTKDLHVKPGETVLFENYYGTVYAKTYVNGQWSNVSRLILKIPVVNTPTITAAGNGKVKISTSTPNCTIYYTTDGSTPSPTHGTRINSSSSIITVGSGKTVKAIAVRSCFTNSEVATYKK